jgi:hypothetical protein
LQRLKQWINNHTRKTSSGEGKQKLLDLSDKKKQRWQPYQAYSRLYYDKLRPIINNAYLDYSEGLDDGKEADSLFKFQNRELRAHLEKETSEVKAEVEAMCEKSVTLREEEEIDALL